MMKLYLVGSRARKENSNDADYDYITTDDLENVNEYFNIKRFKQNGKRYKQFITDDKEIVDIWKVDPDYLESNIFLRTLDKGHVIALYNAINKLNAHLSYDGVKFNDDDKTYSIVDVIKSKPELKKFKKYIIKKKV